MLNKNNYQPKLNLGIYAKNFNATFGQKLKANKAKRPRRKMNGKRVNESCYRFNMA